MVVDNAFSSWLDGQLQLRGLKAKELANKVGVSEATISRVRNGRMPLSPRMKARLTKAFCAKLDTMPSAQRNKDCVADSVWLLPSSPLDNAVNHYALEQGLFLKQGVIARTVGDRDSNSLSLPATGNTIQALFDQGRCVLAIGPDVAFKHVGLEPASRVKSYVYKGFHLVTRANVEVNALDEVPVDQRPYLLKVIFEQLENARIWDNGFERFSWQTARDFEFLELLRVLSGEMTGVAESREAYGAAGNYNKVGIDSLHAIGRQGADFVLVDAGAVATAYNHGDRYKILLTLDSVMRAIAVLAEKPPLTLALTLKKKYRTACASVAVKQFKEFWLEKLSQLEAPAYWQLYCPANFDASRKQRLVQKVKDILVSVQHAMNALHVRDQVINNIGSHYAINAYTTQNKPNTEGFRRAWRECVSINY